MIESSNPPTAIILQQALDVIRRESLQCDQETGGILIGARSSDGAFLVTHATPPGPKAVHNSVYFQRDVDYQQKILNALHERYGVNYLGEWHKHPRSLPVPSGGDLQGVRELLSDPDYAVDSILFPIVICERDLGFQINPFYVSSDEINAGFQSLTWQEIPLAMDMDRVFVKNNPKLVPSVDNEEKRSILQRQVPVQLSQAWRKVERFLPFFAFSGKEKELCDNEIQAINDNIADSRNLDWYQTPEGKERLGHERKVLRSFGLSAEPFMVDEKTICFSFSRAGGREIVAICPKSYPQDPPRLLIRDAPGTKHRPLNGWDWKPNNFLVDIVVPLLGPEMC